MWCLGQSRRERRVLKGDCTLAIAGAAFALERVAIRVIEPLVGQVGFTASEHGDMMDTHCSTIEEE